MQMSQSTCYAISDKWRFLCGHYTAVDSVRLDTVLIALSTLLLSTFLCGRHWALPLGLVLLALTTVPCCERPLCYSRPARLLRLLRWALPLGLVLLALSLLCHAVSVPCVTVAPPACCACCTGPYPSASSYLPSSHYCAML